MKKELLAASLGSVLLLSSCGGVSKENTTEKGSESVTAQVIPTASANYKEYSQENVAKSTGDTVLFFHAKWCPGCKASDIALSKDTIRDDLRVLKVDYDTSKELQKKYGVTSQHTFVQVDSEGNMIKKWMGSKNIDDIETELSKEMKKEAMEDKKVMDKKADTSTGDKKEMSKDDMKAHSDTMKKEKMMDKKEAMSDTPVAAAPGIYGTYSAEKVANAKGDIVLFFKANWCPSCQAADKKLSGATIPKGLTVLKLDYDNSADLQKKYGVNSQHTFVQVDSKGNMIKKWVGGMSVKDIQGQIN